MPSTKLSRVCSPRYATRRRPERDTFGPELARIAGALGQPFMPWQRHVADVGCEINPETGNPAYREVIVTVPRQSGKTTLFLSWQVNRCLSPRWSQPQRSVFTAQSGKDARDKWLDELYPLIEGSSLLKFIRGGKRGMARGMGNEHIRWRNGSLIRLLSTSSSSGHSKTLHQAVMDEIWHDTDDRREQGLRPAMVTIADAQLLICSTAGTIDSTVLNRKVRAGRKAVEADLGFGVAYFEYSAPEDWDPEDEESYFGFMPALCPAPPCACDPAGQWRHTVTLEVIRTERLSMPADQFERAYGNVHKLELFGESVFPGTVWKDRADPESQLVGRPAFSIDTRPDRSATTIGAAGVRADGKGHVEVMEHRPGTGWVVDRIVELAEQWDPVVVVVCPTAPAGAFVKALNEKGFVTDPDRSKGQRRLMLINTTEAAQAAGSFYDGVMNDEVVHLDCPVLNPAVQGATKRELANGAFLWDWKDPTVDISPVVSVSNAHHGYAAWGHVNDQEEIDGPLGA